MYGFFFGVVISSYTDVLSEHDMYDVISIFKWTNLKLQVYNFASNVVYGGEINNNNNNKSLCTHTHTCKEPMCHLVMMRS